MALNTFGEERRLLPSACVPIWGAHLLIVRWRTVEAVIRREQGDRFRLGIEVTQHLDRAGKTIVRRRQRPVRGPAGACPEILMVASKSDSLQ